MLEDEYATKDLIPSGFEYLYVEKNGKFVLKSAAEIKSNEDIDRIKGGLTKERNDHRETKEKLRAFDGMDPDETRNALDRIPELEAASKGKLDDTAIDEIVEKRIGARTGPLERRIKTLSEDVATKDGLIGGYQTKETERTIASAVRAAGKKMSMLPGAIDDAIMYASNVFEIVDGAVITGSKAATEGVDPEVWLSDMKTTRSHWWPESTGLGLQGGKRTGGAVNPFTRANWNLTEQGKLVREDRGRAEAYAKAAGTTIGGGKPSK